MSTLYTFGCSFTENFSIFHDMESETSRKKYVNQYCNNISPDTWNESLAKKLNYELENYAGIHGIKSDNGYEQNCNDSIFNNICHASHKFKKNDIVIVEWTFMERFKWASDDNNCMVSLLPSNYKFIGNDVVIEGILINRTSKLWIDELFKKMKIINSLSNSIGFDVFYWTVDRNITNYKIEEIFDNDKWLVNKKLLNKKDNFGYKDIVFDLGGKTITEETNNEINDDHFGKSAHDILSDLFYNDIINKIK